MGILNCTPDSFSDGGLLDSVDAVVVRAEEMVRAGADLLDFGGESTRPGAVPIPSELQIHRVIPALSEVRARLNVTCSIDTTSATVASAALDAGATMVNDVSAGRFDPDLLPLVARTGAAVVLMHMQGTPQTMQVSPAYAEVVRDVKSFLRDRAEIAIKAGVSRDRIVIDPGIGFGKSVEHNLDLLARQREFLDLGYPLLIGTSRKGFIGHVINEPDPARRQFGTAATICWAVTNGCGIVRVHDVGEMSQVVRMTQAIMARLR